jgi:flagellar motor switch protein FliN
MAISDKQSIEDELNEAIEELKRDEPEAKRPINPKPNLDLIMGIPVDVQVVLGSTSMPVANLMKLGRGSIVTLDKQIGDPVDIVVNGRVIARGEVIVLEDDSSRFGVSLTEVIGSGS